MQSDNRNIQGMFAQNSATFNPYICLYSAEPTFLFLDCTKSVAVLPQDRIYDSVYAIDRAWVDYRWAIYAITGLGCSFKVYTSL